jgi:hypothetical protein
MTQMKMKEIDKIGHIPKADDLTSIRDMLFIIMGNGNRIFQTDLKNQIDRLLHAPWAYPTFEEYLLLMEYLHLITREEEEIILERDVVDFLRNKPWTLKRPLKDYEREFFRKYLLKYRSLQRFLEIVFCGGKHFNYNFEQLVQHSKAVVGRKNILNTYMNYFNLKDDRDPRAMLTWCIQANIVERDRYSNTYFIISNKEPSYEPFVESLIRNYNLVYDRNLRRAKIPDLRVKVCIDLHISLSYFEKMLEIIEANNPNAIYLDRATLARNEVSRYGLKRQGFYYYYITVYPEEIKCQKKSE